MTSYFHTMLQNQRRHVCFVQFARWQLRIRSLLSPSAFCFCLLLRCSYFILVVARSIAVSVYLCLFVCLSVCSHISKTQALVSPNFLYVLPVLIMTTTRCVMYFQFRGWCHILPITDSLARTVMKAPKSCHITPILRSLHWLRITERIEYKLFSLTYKVLTTTQPPYRRKPASFVSS